LPGEIKQRERYTTWHSRKQISRTKNQSHFKEGKEESNKEKGKIGTRYHLTLKQNTMHKTQSPRISATLLRTSSETSERQLVVLRVCLELVASAHK
jgi:hypothetical protein